MAKKLDDLIEKYDSNWFYCICKEKYGNDVLSLLNEVVRDLRDLKRKNKEENNG